MSRQHQSREETVEILGRAKKQMEKAETKEQVLSVLQGAGTMAGYKPVFRCLVMGETPDNSVRWGK